MRSRTPVVNASASSEAVATTTFILLIVAGLILFMTPHYVKLSILDTGNGPEVGTLPDGDLSVEPWHDSALGKIRHYRFINGSTCTEFETGPLIETICR